MMNKRILGSMALMAACGCFGGIGEAGQEPKKHQEATGSLAVPTAEKAFNCNVEALNPAERARHNQLTEKLLAARKATVETEKGYELQFSPADVSMTEIAEWVIAESKCCPFFD